MEKINIDNVELISLKPDDYKELQEMACSYIKIYSYRYDLAGPVLWNITYSDTKNEAVKQVEKIITPLLRENEGIKNVLDMREEAIKKREEAIKVYYSHTWFERFFTSPTRILQKIKNNE